jgi:hypothetical protein
MPVRIFTAKLIDPILILRGVVCTFAGSGEADSCEDLPSKSSASMSCVELLSRYPLQYCGSYYIKKHCCASMRAMCPNGTQTH